MAHALLVVTGLVFGSLALRRAAALLVLAGLVAFLAWPAFDPVAIYCWRNFVFLGGAGLLIAALSGGGMGDDFRGGRLWRPPHRRGRRCRLPLSRPARRRLVAHDRARLRRGCFGFRRAVRAGREELASPLCVAIHLSRWRASVES